MRAPTLNHFKNSSMKLFNLLLLTTLCSVALTSMSKADTCMYDQVSTMTKSGQKLAYKLTRTQVSTQFVDSTVVTQKPTITTTVSNTTTNHVTHQSSTGYWRTYTIRTNSWVSTHGGWNKVCGIWKRRCHSKRGLKVCRSWKKSCASHKIAWNWTVKGNTIITNTKIPAKYTTSSNYIIKTFVSYKSKRRCSAFEANPSRKYCLRRNRRRGCVKWGQIYRSNKCLKWKSIYRRFNLKAGRGLNSKAYKKELKKKNKELKRLIKYQKWCRTIRRQPIQCFNIRTVLNRYRNTIQKFKKEIKRRVAKKLFNRLVKKGSFKKCTMACRNKYSLFKRRRRIRRKKSNGRRLSPYNTPWAIASRKMKRCIAQKCQKIQAMEKADSMFANLKARVVTKRVRRICVRRIRSWSRKSRKFRCASRSHKHSYKRCTRWSKNTGRLTCAKRTTFYGV